MNEQLMTRRWWWPLGPYSAMVPAAAIVAVPRSGSRLAP